MRRELLHFSMMIDSRFDKGNARKGKFWLFIKGLFS